MSLFLKKYALVTGGSRGIGREICIKLSSLGYHILINYKGNEEQAIITQQACMANNVEAHLLQFDVANRNEIENVLGAWVLAAEKNAIIEVLVNNAGIRQDTLMSFMSDEQWNSVIDTSLQGMFYVTRTVLNPMLMNRFGRIINIVSLSGLKGMPGQVNYSAAKAGMIGATKALAQEVARRNVTVNAVAPGFISSDMTADLDEKELSNMVPMRRFGKPEEVAALVGFLVSKEAAYITGQVISINGGLYS
ncbi:MAG: 3-oxoacyl-ACP reductase FabG [Bacteroidetes bacterium]|nr:3-oxoacyl-ACP reductase FabG [Bacteroidota bacterium]MBP6314527.1 3-oxoacyl-ACP reductase FabG [Chitinophagaceae bacterium]